MDILHIETIKHVLCLVSWLILQGSLCWACEGKDMKEVLFACSPLLGSIQTEILRTSDKNYSRTCREYRKYVTCIEKQMTIFCPNAIKRDGKLYEDFSKTKNIYSSLPFNCSTPVYEHQSQTTTPSSGASRNYIHMCIWLPTALILLSVIIFSGSNSIM